MQKNNEAVILPFKRKSDAKVLSPEERESERKRKRSKENLLAAAKKLDW